MPVVLGKQKGKRLLGKSENMGWLKDPTVVTIMLPVATGLNGMRHQDLLCP